MSGIELTGWGLRTDLYQLTMAYGYWKSGRAERRACFHLFYRQAPFQGGFAVVSGVERALSVVEALRFETRELDYLATLKGNDGKPLFEPAFFDHLARRRLKLDISGQREGEVAFPGVPILRVEGPLLETQLVETLLLNLIGYESLVATRAARIAHLAAPGEPVLEFGLRRAQGPDGGLTASRAAFLGGCSATSNVAAGSRFGIPVAGTLAHSWVLSFGSESEAFDAYAQSLPNNVVLLVDTFDTLEGVERAVATGIKLRELGHTLAGIRLDSGDLVALSKAVRRRLDEAGFAETKIVASNDLDEERIVSLRESGACIDIWGVGTRLVTGLGSPSLGAVYKLAAIEGDDGHWQYRAKNSEDAVKASLPGRLQVLRTRASGLYSGDKIFDVDLGPGQSASQVVAEGSLVSKESVELLQPLLRAGQRVYRAEGPHEGRRRLAREIEALPPTLRRLRIPANAEKYPVIIEERLAEVVEELRGSRG